MKLRLAMPPPTCQLAISASAGANSLFLSEHPVSVWIVELAAQSESCFFLGSALRAEADPWPKSRQNWRNPCQPRSSDPPGQSHLKFEREMKGTGFRYQANHRCFERARL
jgi:hypothetical protein